MNRYDFKNVIKRIIVGVAIAFIVMSIKQCNVKAEIINKGQYGLGGWQANQKNGYIVPNSSITGVPPYGDASVFFQLNNELTPDTSYDYVGFKMWFDVYRTTELGDSYCPKYTYSYNSNGQISSIQCSGPYTNSPVVGSYDIQVIAMNSNNETTHCFFSSDIDNVILCPTAKKINRLGFHIGTSYSRLEYRIEVNNSFTYYNMGSTEIVNALQGLSANQQNISNTISDPNISGANTSTNSALNGIENSVDDTLDNAISPNALNTLLTGFVNQLSNSTCSPITLPIPYTNENIVLPCLGTEFSQRIPVIWSLYELIITGVIVLRFWQHAVEFVLNILDPYHIGANNVPTGGGK